MSSRLRRGLLLAAVVAPPFALTPQVGAATPATFVVTTATDPSSGTACPATSTSPCSLRAALAAAAGATDGGVVTFDVPGPFVLTGGGLVVTGGSPVTVLGADDGSTVIDGDNGVRVLQLNQSAVMTLDHVTITHGMAGGPSDNDGFGAGIDVNTGSSLTVLRSRITANTSLNNAGGVDVNTTSQVIFRDSTIDGNTAGGAGGGFDVNTGAPLVLVNTTVSGNTAATGGGLDVITGGLTMVNSTVAGNTTTSGAPSGDAGGILAAANVSVTVTNSIVADNTAPNCAGTVTDGGNNAENGTSCGFASHAVDAEPSLGPLADNGGPVVTRAPAAGSPVLDAGDDATCAASPTGSTPGAGAADARGVPRPQGAHCDIGAFEAVATVTSLRATGPRTSGSHLTLTATVTPGVAVPGPPGGAVTFYDGATVLGTGTLSGSTPDTATLTTGALPAGVHVLSARFAASPLFLGSSGTLTAAIAAPSVRAHSGARTPTGLADTGGRPWYPYAGFALLAAAAVVARRRA